MTGFHVTGQIVNIAVTLCLMTLTSALVFGDGQLYRSASLN